MKKRLLAAILSTAMLLSFAACSNRGNKLPTGDEIMDGTKDVFSSLKQEADKKEANTMQQYETTKKNINGAEFNAGPSGTLKLKSYAILDGPLDSRILVITADYTNNDADYDHNPASALNHLRLYQDGAQLNLSFSSIDKEQATAIKKDATVEVIFTHELRNETSDVEFECEPERTMAVISEKAGSSVEAEPETIKYTLKIK